MVNQVLTAGGKNPASDSTAPHYNAISAACGCTCKLKGLINISGTHSSKDPLIQLLSKQQIAEHTQQTELEALNGFMVCSKSG